MRRQPARLRRVSLTRPKLVTLFLSPSTPAVNVLLRAPAAGRQIGRCVSDDLAHFGGCKRGDTEAWPRDPAGQWTKRANENCSLVMSFDDDDSPCVDLCEWTASEADTWL